MLHLHLIIIAITPSRVSAVGRGFLLIAVDSEKNTEQENDFNIMADVPRETAVRPAATAPVVPALAILDSIVLAMRASV